MKRVKSEQNIIKRLNRIAGQVKGLKRMVKADRDCSQMVIQLSAVRSALGQVGLILVEGHLKECVETAVRKGDAKELAKSLQKVMKQMMK